MTTKRRVKPHPLPENWVVSEQFQWNGRYIQPGTELSITGASGRFRFIKHVRAGAEHEWIDVVGGKKGVSTFRSFHPDRIKTVHRLSKTRENALTNRTSNPKVVS